MFYKHGTKYLVDVESIIYLIYDIYLNRTWDSLNISFVNIR